jgi:cyclohexanone monooxygenase
VTARVLHADYMPQRKYAKGPEILSHCNAILDKYELTDSIFYQTVSTSCSWDEASQRWIVITDRGDTFRARYVVNSTGPLHKPKLADISGMDRFEGTYWHTSRWNWDFTGPQVEDAEQTLGGLHGLRVGIIGTGASAVQVIPPMAKAAKHLYVFQRTPSSIDVRADRPTDPERWAKDSQEPGFAYKRRAYFDAATSGGFVATGGGGGGDGKKQLTAAERAKKAADAANEAEMANYRIMQRIR